MTEDWFKRRLSEMGGETRTIASMFGASATGPVPNVPSAKRLKQRNGSETERSSFTDCPLCDRPFHPALVQAHAENCAGAPAPAMKKEIEKPVESTESTLSTSPTDTRLPAVVPVTAEAPTHPNQAKKQTSEAFASLMQAQRFAKCEVVFSVWIEGEVWRWRVTRGTEQNFSSEQTQSVTQHGHPNTTPGKQWRAVTTFKEKTNEGKPCVTSVRLVTNVCQGAEKTPMTSKINSESSSPNSLTPGVLKSALQKAIRRGKCAEAARLAHALLTANPAEALRRLLVICVEDALLHPTVPLITWFMLSQSKGYVLGAEANAAVARFAAELVTNVCQGAEKTPMTSKINSESSSPNSLTPGVLKSALQKAIRRGKCAEAARLAHALLTANPAEALRRLLVICVEDALLHPTVPLITWFMLSQSKGYVLGAEANAAVARFAAELAGCESVDRLGTAGDKGK